MAANIFWFIKLVELQLSVFVYFLGQLSKHKQTMVHTRTLT